MILEISGCLAYRWVAAFFVAESAETLNLIELYYVLRHVVSDEVLRGKWSLLE